MFLNSGSTLALERGNELVEEAAVQSALPLVGVAQVVIEAATNSDIKCRRSNFN